MNNPEDNQLENKDWRVEARELAAELASETDWSEWARSEDEEAEKFGDKIIAFVQSLLDKQVGKWVECMDCKAHKPIVVCIPCRNRFRDRALDKQAEKQREMILDLVQENREGTFTDDAGHDCWYIDDLITALTNHFNKDLTNNNE